MLKSVSLLILLALGGLAWQAEAQELEIEGSYVLLVEDLPIKLTAEAGWDFTFWRYPYPGARVVEGIDDKGRATLLIQELPGGNTQITATQSVTNFLKQEDGTYKKETRQQVLSRTFRYKVGPDPDPDPDPDPIPDPDPDPTPDNAPFPAPGLTVLFTRETNNDHLLSLEESDIIGGRAVRSWLAANCVQEGQHKAYRFWDDDLEDPTSTGRPAPITLASELWQKAYAVADRDAPEDTPWVVISNGKTGVSMKMPSTVESMIAELEKYK